MPRVASFLLAFGSGLPSPPGVVAAASPASSLRVCAREAAGERRVVAGGTVIVVAADGAAVAATTGGDGCVSLSLAPGSYRVTVTGPPEGGGSFFDGTVELAAGRGSTVEATLGLAVAETQELVVVERREREGETRRTIRPDEAQRLPGGENDALKSVQNLPGVARAPYGLGMLVVRGAAPGDTRVFLDGHEIPQLFHFGGLNSVFPTEALSRIDLLPGGFGVRYGRTIGGVVDVETREAREGPWKGHVDADLYDASGLAEGPAAKGTTVMAAARRSYVDLLLPALAPGRSLDWTVAPRYYDYQLRIDGRPREDGTRPRLMAYGSDDAFTYVIRRRGADGLAGQYLFRTAFHRVQSTLSRSLPGGFAGSLVPSVGHQLLTIDGGGAIAVRGARTAAGLRAEARGSLSERASLLLGIDAQLQRDSFQVDMADDANSGARSPDRRRIASGAYASAAVGLYAESEIAAGQGLTVVPGLRIDGYQPAAAATFDPRLAARYRFDEHRWTKAYLGLYHQPPQFYEWDARIGNPRLRPARAVQTGIGGGQELSRAVAVEAEAFYKWLDDLPVQAVGDPTDPSARTRLTNERVGRVYGVEALVRRAASERFHGWISYTLSRSERNSPYTRGWKPFQLDQTHILTAVTGLTLRRGWQAGARFRYVTGNPTHVVEEAVYDADADRYVPIPGFRRQARLPPFHQLDLRVDKRWVWSGWTLVGYVDVQNVYSRPNAERLRYDFDYSERRYVTGLPIFPSIGVRGEF